MREFQLPLLFEAQPRPDNGGFPSVVPLAIRYDRDLAMFRQAGSPELRSMLNKIYAAGSMLSCGMDEGAGKIRADASLRFLLQCRELPGRSLLEIGCGNGYLLTRVRQAGAAVTGLEPGPQGIEARRRLGLDVIEGSFPSQQIRRRFDLVVHFNVLEHIEDPEAFFLANKALLNPQGAILCGVPNCEPYLEEGDISIFAHEHFSYFTRCSLQRLAARCGLRLLWAEPGAEGGMLFAHLVASSGAEGFPPATSHVSPTQFFRRAARLQRAIAQFVSASPPQDVAIYCPLRALNALFTAGITACRLIDDNPNLTRKYLPCMTQPIEDFSGLRERPPQRLLIFSRTFGDRLRARCAAAPELAAVDIKTIADLDGPGERA